MKARNENPLGRLRNVSPTTATTIGLLYLLVVGIVDFWVPPEMRFTLLYAFGVAFIGACAGFWLSLGGAALATGLLLLVELLTVHPPYSPWVVWWNASTRFLVLAGIGWLAAKASDLARHLRQLVDERTAELRAEVEHHKATAATLAETVERFEQVVNNISEVFWLVELPDYRVVYASPGFERVWGRPRETAYGDPAGWQSALHPDDREQIRRRIPLEQPKGGYDVEYRIVRPDGAVRWIRDRAFPVRNSQGEVYRMAGIAEDITERKRTRELLQTQAAILENMAEGVVVTDEQGAIVQMNPAAERIWCYRREEVMGQPASVFSALPEPEAAAVMREVLSTLEQTGTWRGIFHNRRKDGTLISCEATISRLELQGRKLMVAVEQEVTERLRAEQALRQSEETLRAFLQAIPEAAMLLDRNGLLLVGNQAAARNLGLPENALAGKCVFEFLPPAVAAARKAKLEQVFASGKAMQFPDGRGDRSFVSWVSPVRDSSGTVSRAAVIAFDVTERQRAEEALREAHDLLERRVRERTAQLESLYQTAPVGLCVLDTDFRYVQINERLAAMNGRPVAEHIGRTLREIVPQMAEGIEAICRQVIASGQSVMGLEVETTTDGQPSLRRTGVTHWVPLKQADGSVTAVSVVVEEITERKRMEEALREAHDLLEARVQQRTADLQAANAALAESEERYRSLVTNLNVGVYRTEPVPGGRFLHANPALARIEGFASVEALMSVSVCDTYQDLGDRAAFLAELFRHGSLTNYELRLKKADGTPIYGSVNATVHRRPDGEVDWIDGVLEDITERKQVEEALRTSEERYRTLAEASPDAIFILDRDARAQYMNSKAAGLWRCQPQDLIGRTQAELFPADIAQRQARVVRDVIETGSPLRREMPQTFPVGEQWIEIRLAPLYDAEGAATSVMGICRDITERKRAEQQLAETLDLNQKMIAASTIGIAAYKTSGECVFANDALCRMVGGSPSEVSQDNFRCLDSWRESGMLRLAEEVLNQDQSRSGEMHATTRFGKAVAMDCHLAPFISNGQPHLLVMVLDIAERKQAQALLQAQRDVGVSLSLTSDLRVALKRLLEVAVRIGGLDCGGVYLLNPVTQELDLAAHLGLSSTFTLGVARYSADSSEMTLIRQGRSVFGTFENLPVPHPPALRREGLRAIAVIPLSHNRRIVGALNLASHTADSIPAQTQIVVEAIAAQAAGAIARISAETESRRLAKQILEISDREHARIGQDIHDGLCQHLVSLAFDANALQCRLTDRRLPEAKTAQRIAHDLDQAITEARQLSRGLFPVRLTKGGLQSALLEMAAAARARFKIRCRFTSKGPVVVESSVVATHLYRIAQEALSNAVRHSGARSISIRLRAGDRALELSVEDDGTGLPSAGWKIKGGMGMHIMDYRARTIGGTLQIGPGNRGGTRVSCCVPAHEGRQSTA